MHILAIESSEVICYNKRRAFIINQNALHMRLPLANSVHIGRLCPNLRLWHNKRRAFIINQNALHMRLPLANSVHIGRLCPNLWLWHNKRRAFIIAYYTYSIALI